LSEDSKKYFKGDVLMADTLRLAVILAAGMGTRLKDEGKTKPKGFLHMGRRPIIQESIDKLLRADIRQIIIVTGHHFEFYDRLKESYPGIIETIYNSQYARSGSMYSLYCARARLLEDFLLLESDIIYEERALSEILQFSKVNGVLLSGPTASGDEVYVAVSGARIIGMSKDLGEIGSNIAGELVGITKVSRFLFKGMITAAEAMFGHTLQVAYETDCLSAVALWYPLYYHLVPDLIWSEIDAPSDFRRAKNRVYPAILKQA
jgi:2-aminoethylphosphonate-pyruvate transaminase